MDVVPLLVFCSLILAAAGVGMFLYSVRNREPEHMDRLSLLPLEDDAEPLETNKTEPSPNTSATLGGDASEAPPLE